MSHCDYNVPPDLPPGKAATIFWSAALGSSLLWIFLPSLLHEGYRPDVIELFLAGKEWVLSTRKHPMLPAWILETVSLLSGRCFAAPFLVSQFCALLTLWSVWRFARLVLSERKALLGTLVMLPYWFFSFESIKYNQNIPLIALWSLAVLLVFQAFQTNRIRNWLGAGLCLGLAFHSKYSALFLVLSILLYMIVRPEGRKYWKTIGPYLTILTAFLVFLPHLIWLFQNDLATLQYAAGAYRVNAFWYHLFYPLRFCVCELGYLALPMLSLLPVLGFRWKRKTLTEKKSLQARAFLFYCMAVPFLLHVLIAAVFKRKLNGDYGAAFWPYFGVFLLLCFQSTTEKRKIFASCRLIGIFEGITMFAFLVQATVSPHILGTARGVQLPMYRLGAECDRIWSEHSPLPCPYITGDWFLAGSAACVMKDRPSVHFYYNDIGDPEAIPTGPWSQDADMNEKGGLILWRCPAVWEKSRDTVPGYLSERFPKAVPLEEIIEIPYKTTAPVFPLQVGVAIIVPEVKTPP